MTNPRIAIRVEQELKGKVENYADKYYDSRAKFLEDALKALSERQNQDEDESLDTGIVWTAAERDEINEALDLTGTELPNLIKDLVLKEARKIVQRSKAAQEFTEQLKGATKVQPTTKAGFAEFRINECIEALKAHNLGCEYILDKWLINYGLVHALVRCNPKTLKGWMTEHQSEIDTHHKETGLDVVTTRFNTGAEFTDEYGEKVRKNNALPSKTKDPDSYERALQGLRAELGLTQLA